MRNGKIATLPSSIRDELNLRMENGEQGNELLAWLNGLPEVRERVKGSPEGAPISKQNLSEWRLGGFHEWHLHHELMKEAYNLTEHAGQLEEAVDGPLLAGKMAVILAARYAALLNSWDGAPNAEFEEKLRVLRGLNRDLALLQKTLQQAGRHENEFLQHREDEWQKQQEKMKERALAPVTAAMERSGMQALFETFYPRTDAGRLAELATALKFDLPLPKKGRKGRSVQKETNKAESRKQKAGIARKAASGQTGSNRVKPSQAIADCGLRIADCAQDEPSGREYSVRGEKSAGETPALPGKLNSDSGQDESNLVRRSQSAATGGSGPAGQTESNPVKPSQAIADCGLRIADCGFATDGHR
jgi:hypothetical protein